MQDWFEFWGGALQCLWPVPQRYAGPLVLMVRVIDQVDLLMHWSLANVSSNFSQQYLMPLLCLLQNARLCHPSRKPCGASLVHKENCPRHYPWCKERGMEQKMASMKRNNLENIKKIQHLLVYLLNEGEEYSLEVLKQYFPLTSALKESQNKNEVTVENSGSLGSSQMDAWQEDLGS